MKYCLIFLSAWIFIGCSHPESREENLKKRGVLYIKIGDTELMTKLINQSQSKSDSSHSNSSYLYFDITINRLAGDKFTKDKTVYLDFDMQKDFVAAVNRDSLQAAFCQKIENGKSESYEYIVAFEKPANVEATGVTLVYNDKIFGVGKLAFVYQSNDLKNLEPKS